MEMVLTRQTALASEHFLPFTDGYLGLGLGLGFKSESVFKF